MGRKYNSEGQRLAPAAPPATILTLISAATIRPRIYEWVISCGKAPADQAVKFSMIRFTASSIAAVAVTPTPMDPNDPTCIATAQQNCNAGAGEPTYTDTLQTISLNQQATFRWASPIENAIILPATVDNGVGLQFTAVSGGTSQYQANFLHEE